jgi:DNA polymerase-3 subunit beta
MVLPAELLAVLHGRREDALVSASSGTAVVVVGDREVVLTSLPGEDWPQPPEPKADVALDVPSADLLAAINRVAHCAAIETTRPYLCGVFIEAGETDLRLTATNGHKLAHESLPVKALGTGSGIVANKTIEVLQAALRKQSGDVTVVLEAGRRLVSFRVGPVRITANLIEGNYPAYRRVIPAGPFASRLRVDAGNLATNVKGLRLAREQPVKMKLGEGALMIEAYPKEPQKGRKATPQSSAKAKLNSSSTLEGRPIVIGFRGQYLADFGRSLTGEIIIDMTTDPGEPVKLTAPEAPRWQGVLMPFRLADYKR